MYKHIKYFINTYKDRWNLLYIYVFIYTFLNTCKIFKGVTTNPPTTWSPNTVMFSMHCFWSVRLTKLSSWSTSQIKSQDGKYIHAASNMVQLYVKWLEECNETKVLKSKWNFINVKKAEEKEVTKLQDPLHSSNFNRDWIQDTKWSRRKKIFCLKSSTKQK